MKHPRDLSNIHVRLDFHSDCYVIFLMFPLCIELQPYIVNTDIFNTSMPIIPGFQIAVDSRFFFGGGGDFNCFQLVEKGGIN